MANEDHKDFETKPIGIVKWRRRWQVALDNFDRSGLPFVPQPSTIIIKGDAALELRASLYIKSDTAFAFESEYIKGDTSLIAELAKYIKSDSVFVRNAVYIKGDALLLLNVPLPDLGEDPAATKPGAIQRTWLQVKSVTKDVT